MASQPIMQFYAELTDAHIPIWRRFQVMGNVRFSRLAYILMTMFEMQASHLFAFDIDMADNVRNRAGDELQTERMAQMLEGWGEALLRIERPIEDDYPAMLFQEQQIRVIDASEEMVKHVFTTPGYEGSFEYDFGDGWDVRFTLEDVFEDSELPGSELPRVIGGEGFGIIEDCGGVWGLEEIDKAFRKGKGESYEEYREWLGVDKLDLRAFDIQDMNFRLKKVPRIYRDFYELQLEPTQRSIDILTRRYKK